MRNHVLLHLAEITDRAGNAVRRRNSARRTRWWSEMTSKSIQVGCRQPVFQRAGMCALRLDDAGRLSVVRSVIFVTRQQTGTIPGKLAAGHHQAIVVRMNRKTGTALISALILALNSVVFCAAGALNCSAFSVSACHLQEQGCHEHQRHEPRENQRCACCESAPCAARTELTRPDSRSASDRVATFAPHCIAVMRLNPSRSGESLPRVTESPPYPSVPIFLFQQTLLI